MRVSCCSHVSFKNFEVRLSRTRGFAEIRLQGDQVDISNFNNFKSFSILHVVLIFLGHLTSKLDGDVTKEVKDTTS